MSRQTNCPTCRAPVTAEGGGYYDDPVSYYFDHTAHQFLKDDVTRLETENKKLREQLANAKAHARRMVKGRKAAEAIARAALSVEMAKAQERARASVPVELISALLIELESAKKHNDRLKTKVGKYLGELDSASDSAATFHADWVRALEMRDQARAEAAEYKGSFQAVDGVLALFFDRPDDREAQDIAAYIRQERAELLAQVETIKAAIGPTDGREDWATLTARIVRDHGWRYGLTGPADERVTNP